MTTKEHAAADAAVVHFRDKREGAWEELRAVIDTKAVDALISHYAGTATEKQRAKADAEIALAEKMTDAEADALSQRVVKAMQGHFANYIEQERRRDKLYRVTMDNLDYIIDISRQGKDFAIYRADVSAQWKAYLQASMRSRIAKVDTVPAPTTERTPSND